jgi:Cu(I)/Ag(I) efflux system membrane fusion protein
VYNPDRAWAILSIYGESQGLVKTGNLVEITPETAPDKTFDATIDFIEPFFRNESKTLSARVYFNNSQLKIPIGSQVKATIFANTKATYWLPSSAVLSLGLDAVVFRKTQSGFKTLKITTGISYQDYIQILSGINSTDTVAINAQYLMDSESLIKIKK